MTDKYMKFKKKGQITAFIIIAIVIVGVIAILFAVRGKIFDSGAEEISPDVAPIHSFVEKCIRESGEQAVYYIGQTGGYFKVSNYSIDNGIAFYYDRGKNYMPAKEIIEREIGYYMDYMLFFCTKNFVDFSDFDIKQSKIKTKAKIEKNKVVFNVEYPLSISKGRKSYLFKKFNGIEVPVRLDRVYDLAYNITREQLIDKDVICASCIYDAAIDRDLYVEMNQYGEGVILFTIRDEKSQINNMDYRFNFANKYDFK